MEQKAVDFKNMFNLKGQVAVVTGGGGALGSLQKASRILWGNGKQNIT